MEQLGAGQVRRDDGLLHQERDPVWALTQLTGGSTEPPAEGDQEMPAQEPGTRPHRPSNLQLFADVSVNRTTSTVTAALTNTGTVGASFAVYFLTSFAGSVVPAGVNTGQVPVVTAAAGSKTLDLTLASEGAQAIVYTVTPNDYKGSTKTVTVKTGRSHVISWPTDEYGYYDVVITTDSADGFRRRYAGRIA